MFKKGFTLIEFLIVIAILALVAGAILWSLNSFRSRQAVKNTRGEIISALALVRARSLNGLNDKAHGVNFNNEQMTIFSGTTFSAGAPDNQVISLPLVSLSLNLAGGESVVFDRLTGATTNTGTIVINSLSGNDTATVTILSTGLVADE